MKELSIEQKAQRYDEAFERAKYYQKENGSAVISAIFPELKESGDEMIRKWIINEIKVKHHNLDEDNVDFVDKAIAWLERQGEKPQGKFALGAWKDIRFEVYQQAGGNGHEANVSDDATKMFSLNDIDEIIKKIAESREMNRVVTWSEEDEEMLSGATGAVSAADYYTYDDKRKIESWLESLKQRIVR